MAEHKRANVYTTNGNLVGCKMTLSEIMKQPSGIYIINRKKISRNDQRLTRDLK